MKKTLITIFICLLFGLQIRLWGKHDGIRDVLRLKHSITLQTKEVERLKQRNHRLDLEVQALKNFPEALEERARVELGMIKENETFCLVVEPNH